MRRDYLQDITKSIKEIETALRNNDKKEALFIAKEMQNDTTMMVHELQTERFSNKKMAKELLKLAKSLVSEKGTGYAWIIDEDKIGAHRKGTIGPRGANQVLIAQLRKGEGDKFEMYDDDKELYYTGRIVGDFNGFEPLDDLGTPDAGAVLIKYTTGPNKGGFL